MTELLRNRMSGKSYFFTLALPEWYSGKSMLPIRGLCLELVKIKQRHLFRLDALVILPKYVQGILTLSDDTGEAILAWRALIKEFAGLVSASGMLESDDLEGRRFFGYALQDDRDFDRHLNFLHNNPVNQGLVKLVADWPYSTFFTYVQQGVYPLYWKMENA